jgi:ferritin-like metal-binding protein YciE
MTKLNSLQDLFTVGIVDIYDAEKQLLIAMPKMIRMASHRTLRAILESHLEETGDQVERLGQAMDILDLRPETRFSAPMQAILKEGMDLLEASASPAVLNAACITAAHMIEQYEVGAYGMLAASCRMLEYRPEVFSLLSASEQEERDADANLLELAGSGIFAEAMGLVRLEAN